MKVEIEDLLAQYCEGCLSVKDSITFSQWINESDENKNQAKEYISLDQKKKQQYFLQNYSETSAWKTLLQKKAKKHQRRINIRTAVAAVTVIALISSNLVINALKQDVTSLIPIENATSIVVKTYDGNDIFVGDSKNTDIILVDGATIINKTDRLLYKTDSTVVDKAEMNTLLVPRKKRCNIELTDGTLVNVNSETELQYPTNFSGSERRQINLVSGEIFLDVAKDDDKPFILKINDLEVVVLGTQFNVSAYKDSKKIEVTLKEGSISAVLNGRVRGNQDSIRLYPNQQLEVNYDDMKLYKKQVNVNEEIAWIENKFYFNNKTLWEITRILCRRYDYDIQIETEELKNLRYTVKVSEKDSIEFILNRLQKYGEFVYEKSESCIIIHNN